MMIYVINRYQNKRKNIKQHSGYEKLIDYSSIFRTVDSPKWFSKILSKIVKSKPKDYLSHTYGKEILVLFMALITGRPVFYLYADKDAYLLPLLKRKFKLNHLRLYGTLHWPVEDASEFSFYKYDLSSNFNGIITLSKNKSLNIKCKRKVIYHGIDLCFWKNDDLNLNSKSYYFLVGQSNRDHERQAELMYKILKIEPDAEFKVLIRNKKFYSLYKMIPNTEVINKSVTDNELKKLYINSKAIILIQKNCLASNVVLETIATQRPIITNRVGDIEEYFQKDLFINCSNPNSFLQNLCLSDLKRIEMIDYFGCLRKNYEWYIVAEKTKKFILNNN